MDTGPPLQQHDPLLRAALSTRRPELLPISRLIAAHACAADLTVVTGNEHEFRRVPGLRVENWLVG